MYMKSMLAIMMFGAVDLMLLMLFLSGLLSVMVASAGLCVRGGAVALTSQCLPHSSIPTCLLAISPSVGPVCLLICTKALSLRAMCTRLWPRLSIKQ